MGAGSREEDASKPKSGAPFRSIRSGPSAGQGCGSAAPAALNCADGLLSLCHDRASPRYDQPPLHRPWRICRQRPSRRRGVRPRRRSV
ncbi:hypothetical protein DXU07_12170 [Bradyrhizobium elkanii]